MKSIKYFLALGLIGLSVTGSETHAATVAAQSEAKESEGQSQDVVVVPYTYRDGQIQVLLFKEKDNKFHTMAMQKKENQKKESIKNALLQVIGEKYSAGAKQLEAEDTMEKSFVADDGKGIHYLVKVKYVDANEPDAQWLSYDQLTAQSQSGRLADDAAEIYESKAYNDLAKSYKAAKPAKKGRSKRK